jgi:hypothetical protein
MVIIRLRQLLVPYGQPGLGSAIRAATWTENQVRIACEEAFLQTTFGARRRQQLLALALCWHDRLDAAHDLAQQQGGTQDMDLIHAILHRRQADRDNARSWLRRVGVHPSWKHLPPVAAAEGLTDLVRRGAWQADRFLARCLSATGTAGALLRRLQAAELLAVLDCLSLRPNTTPITTP